MTKRWFLVLALLCAAALALGLFWMLMPRQVEPAPPEALYTLGDAGGHVALYPAAQGTRQRGQPLQVYDELYTHLLPERDVLSLQQGIPVYSEEELQRLLEDFGL